VQLNITFAAPRPRTPYTAVEETSLLGALVNAVNRSSFQGEQALPCMYSTCTARCMCGTLWVHRHRGRGGLLAMVDCTHTDAAACKCVRPCTARHHGLLLERMNA
jgi:hypothetical protein